MITILMDEIICIEAQVNQAILFTDEDSLLINNGISAIHNKLNIEEFLRVHRSFVLSMNHIKEVIKDTNGFQIVTSNNNKINVSSTYTNILTAIRKF